MLAGFLPFDEEILPKLFKKIKDGEYEIPEGFNPAAKDLV